MRDRESLFTEFMTDFKKHERERLKIREEKVRSFSILSEASDLIDTWRIGKKEISIKTYMIFMQPLIDLRQKLIYFYFNAHKKN